MDSTLNTERPEKGTRTGRHQDRPSKLAALFPLLRRVLDRIAPVQY